MHTGQHEGENQRVVYLFSVKHGDYSSQPYFHQDPKTNCNFVTSLLCKWPSHITIKHLVLKLRLVLETSKTEKPKPVYQVVREFFARLF